MRGVEALAVLRTLVLRDNNLTALVGLSGLRNLETLDVAGNHVREMKREWYWRVGGGGEVAIYPRRASACLVAWPWEVPIRVDADARVRLCSGLMESTPSRPPPTTNFS